MNECILEIAENDRYLCIERGHVLVTQRDIILGQIPVDSLGGVLLTAEGISLSKRFLERMGEENIPVFICGKQYIPVSICTPVSPHYKHLAVVQSQLSTSPILKKKIWKHIVENKIRNQNAALKLCHGKTMPACEQNRVLASCCESE